MGDLRGVTVLAFTHLIAGTYCTDTLAYHGADVIQVEPINEEVYKEATPAIEKFADLDRQHQILAVDMKSEEGKEIIGEIVNVADLIVTNYSLEMQAELGIDYETVSNYNPRISTVHITGYGLTAGEKTNVEVENGVAQLAKESQEIILQENLALPQFIAGKQGVIGAILALQTRDKSGRGYFVDVGNMDSMMSLLANDLINSRFGSGFSAN